MTDSRNQRLAFWIITAVCALAICVCLICDLAVNGGLTWFVYPCSAIPFVWAAVSPVMLLKRHRALGSMAAVSLTLIPLLYSLAYFTDGGGWFYPLGLPLAITGICALWITYLVTRFLRGRLNIWYLAAFFMFLYGVAVNFAAEYFIAMYLGESLLTLNNVFDLLACVVITVLLAVVGRGQPAAGRGAVKDEAPAPDKDDGPAPEPEPPVFIPESSEETKA